MWEGDRKKTPNGSFKIVVKKITINGGLQSFNDYPNFVKSYRRLGDRKAKVLSQVNARYALQHATRPEEEIGPLILLTN
jgi:hypothetical protein